MFLKRFFIVKFPDGSYLIDPDKNGGKARTEQIEMAEPFSQQEYAIKTIEMNPEMDWKGYKIVEGEIQIKELDRQIKSRKGRAETPKTLTIDLPSGQVMIVDITEPSDINSDNGIHIAVYETSEHSANLDEAVTPTMGQISFALPKILEFLTKEL